MKNIIICVSSDMMKVIIPRSYMRCVACMGEATNAYVTISQKVKSKLRLGRRRPRLQNNIKVDLGELACVDINCSDFGTIKCVLFS